MCSQKPSVTVMRARTETFSSSLYSKVDQARSGQARTASRAGAVSMVVSVCGSRWWGCKLSGAGRGGEMLGH